MWKPQIEAFASRYRILTYDHPGHGKSETPTDSETRPIGQYGYDLIALLDHLEIEQAHFCGLSLGGMVGLWLAAHASERFPSIFISNTTARIENTLLLRQRIADLEKSQNLASIQSSVMGKWFTENFARVAPEALDEARAMLLETDIKGYISASKTVCSLDLTEELLTIKQTLLILYGEYDQATPKEWSLSMHEQLPKSQLRRIDAAHLSNIESPEVFNEILAEWLQGEMAKDS